MSALARQGTLKNLKHRIVDAMPTISTAMTVLENAFRDSERRIRLIIMSDGRLDSIKVPTRQFFSHGSTALVDLALCEVLRSYSDTPHSVGPFWTSDRPVAETAT